MGGGGFLVIGILRRFARVVHAGRLSRSRFLLRRLLLADEAFAVGIHVRKGERLGGLPLRDDPDDAMHAALTAAYNADNEIAFADCDGPIGTDDTRADVGNFNIKTMRKTRGESGAALVAVTAKPTAIFALGVVIAT